MATDARNSLRSRLGAFGVRMSVVVSDAEMVEVACQVFGVSARSIDEVWARTNQLTKRERSRLAGVAARSRRLRRYFCKSTPPAIRSLDPEKEEQAIVARARWSIAQLDADDPGRFEAEEFLRRPTWSQLA